MNSILSALINGVIVSACITAGVWFVMRFFASTRIWNAATRYAVWWATLVVTVAIPLVFMSMQRLRLVHRASLPPAIHGVPTPGVQIETDSLSPPSVPSHSTAPAGNTPPPSSLFPVQLLSGRWVEWVFLAWALLSAFMLARLAVSYVSLERRKRRACSLPAYTTRLQEWLACCGAGKRRVRLAVSADITTPVAAGPYRPSILIPAQMFGVLEEDELDQIGLHEAAHLGRLDDYALLAERFLEAVFVLHPVVHWIARRLDLEREMACDDVVVQITGRPAPYASCLTRVVELAGGVSASTLAASAAGPASDLERRVEMLLDNTRNTGTRLLKLRLSAAVTVLGLMVWTASGVPDFIVLAAPLAEKPAPSPEPIPAVAGPPPAPAQIEARAVSRPEPSRTAPQQPQIASREATRPDAVSVMVPVVVRDSRDRYVSGLEIEHFKVFEDGIEQDISQFVASTNELSVAVVLDMRDGNASNQIAQQTAEGLLRNSPPGFEFLLISARSSGPAGLLEGVRMGLTKLASASNRRKVVLIISEGNDRFSPDMDHVAMLAGSPDVPIYAISLAQLYPGQVNEAGAMSGAALLDVITEQSGGRHSAIADQNDLPDILTKLSVEWRNGYLLGYQPRNTSRAGQYRQIRVELLPPRGIQQLHTIIRHGYFASSQGR